MKKLKNLNLVTVIALAFTSLSGTDGLAKAKFDEFKYNKKYEKYGIRVIRPKFFLKEDKVEITGSLNSTINETFLYNLGADVSALYFFNETLGLGLTGNYNLNFDKEEKRILNDQHLLKTRVLRNNYNLKATLEWNPFYGKWRHSDYNIVYFDTFFSINVGSSGLNWDYADYCTGEGASKSALQKHYLGYGAGMGQRYFMSENSSVKWQIDINRIAYNENDSSCSIKTSDEQDTAYYDIVSFRLGYSYFID